MKKIINIFTAIMLFIISLLTILMFLIKIKNFDNAIMSSIPDSEQKIVYFNSIDEINSVIEHSYKKTLKIVYFGKEYYCFCDILDLENKNIIINNEQLPKTINFCAIKVYIGQKSLISEILNI